jgi:hypothetical protein
MLKIDYRNYHAWHQTTLTKQPSLAMTQMESTPNRVVNKTIDTLKQWKETMAKCQILT